MTTLDQFKEQNENNYNKYAMIKNKKGFKEILMKRILK